MDLNLLKKELFGGSGTGISSPVSDEKPDWDTLIENYSSKYPSVPKNVVKAIIQQESGGNHKAVGPMTKYGTAKGAGQFIDSTAKQYIPGWQSPEDSFNPDKSVAGIFNYMDTLIRENKGDIKKAVGRYFGTGVDPVLNKSTDEYSSEVMEKAGMQQGTVQQAPLQDPNVDFIKRTLFGDVQQQAIPQPQPTMQPITGVQQPLQEQQPTEKKQLPFVGNFVEMLKTMARTPISILRGIGEGAMSATNKVATGQIDNAIKSLNDNKDKYATGIPENDPIIKRMLSGLPFITYDKLQEIKNEKGVYDTQSLYSMLEDAKNKRTEFNPKDVTEPIRSVENLLKEKDVERLGGAGGVLQDLTSGVTQVAAQLGLNAINPSLAATSMISLIGGSSIEELEKKGVDPMDGAALSLANAALQYPLEKIGLGKIADNMAVKNATGQVLKRVVSSFLGEGVTEGIQEIPDYILTDWFVKTKGMDLKEKIDTLVKDLPELGKRAGYSGVIGGLTGSAVTGAGIAVDRALNGKERAEKKSIEDAWNQEMADAQQAQGDESIAGKIASEQQQPEVEIPEELQPEPAVQKTSQKPAEEQGIYKEKPGSKPVLKSIVERTEQDVKERTEAIRYAYGKMGVQSIEEFTGLPEDQQAEKFNKLDDLTAKDEKAKPAMLEFARLLDLYEQGDTKQVKEIEQPVVESKEVEYKGKTVIFKGPVKKFNGKDVSKEYIGEIVGSTSTGNILQISVKDKAGNERVHNVPVKRLMEIDGVETVPEKITITKEETGNKVEEIRGTEEQIEKGRKVLESIADPDVVYQGMNPGMRGKSYATGKETYFAPTYEIKDKITGANITLSEDQLTPEIIKSKLEEKRSKQSEFKEKEDENRGQQRTEAVATGTGTGSGRNDVKATDVPSVQPVTEKQEESTVSPDKDLIVKAHDGSNTRYSYDDLDLEDYNTTKKNYEDYKANLAERETVLSKMPVSKEQAWEKRDIARTKHAINKWEKEVKPWMEKGLKEKNISFESPVIERPEEQKAEIEAINTNPTELQKEAGNYRKAHIKRDGMDISIENAAGSERSGKDKSGKEWKTQMNHDYGYIRGTKGADAYRGRATDQLDVFINPGSEEGGDVFVVNQKDPTTGKFDEHKVLIGFSNKVEAAKAYNSNYEPGWKGMKSIVRMPMDKFKQWAYTDLTKNELKEKMVQQGFNTEQTGAPEKENVGEIIKGDEILFDISGKGNFAKGKVMDETEDTYTIKTTSGNVIFKTKDLVKSDPDFKRSVEEVDRKNADTDVKLPGYEDKNFVARKREGFWWLYDKDSNEMVYGGDEFPFPSKESLIESAKENYKPKKEQTGATKNKLESTNNIKESTDGREVSQKTETVLSEKVETPSVLFHGTRSGNIIEKFNLDNANKGVGSNAFAQGDLGVYLTSSETAAKYFSRKAGESNALADRSIDGIEAIKNATEALSGEKDGNIVSVELPADIRIKDLDHYPTKTEAAKYKTEGYDGLRFEEKGFSGVEDFPTDKLSTEEDLSKSKTTVIFDPGKVKVLKNTDKKKTSSPQFSKETGDVFDGTENADTRTKAQKEIDEYQKEIDEYQKEIDEYQKKKEEERKAKDKGLKGTPLFDPEEQEARATVQEDIFDQNKVSTRKKIGGRPLADDGTYADIGELVMPGTKPVTQKQEQEVVKDNENVARSMQMPEIVEMVKAINGGKVPRIKERVGKDPALNGIFKTGSQEIHLRADLFKDPIVAAKVLAHEIGHLSDYLPNKTMSRGNILGRIATLKNYTAALLSANKKINKSEIVEELKALSMKWKPFDPKKDKKYTAYRNSSKELYADAFSVLINNPGMLEKEAPKFYDAFTQFLGRKPDLEKIYTEIQTRLFDPNAVGKHRLEGLYSMVDQTDNLRQEARDRAKKERLSVGDFIYKYLIDRDYALLKLIGKGKKGSEGAAIKAQKAKDEIEQTKYLATRVQNFVEDIADSVLKPLSDNGLTHSDLGVYMFLNRASTERATIANPRGFGEVESISTMEELEKQLGKEKFEKLKGIDKAYRELRKSIILEAEKAGLYTPDLVKTMKERVDSYAKFSVASYMEEKFGGEASSKVFHQIGTLADIANPFVETVLQDMSVIRSAKINTMKSTVLDFLSEMGESAEADMVFSQDINGRIAKPPKDPNKKLVHRMKDGKMESFYISKEIADSFERNPVESNAVAEIISTITSPIKQVLVAKNPIWMARNVLRDFQATVKNNPEVKLRDIPKLAKYYSEAYTEVIGSVFKGNRSTDLREMRENFMLNPDRVYSGKDVYYDNEIERIATEWQVDPRQAERYGSVKGRIKQAWDILNKMGRVSELGGKLAGYKYLKGETKLSTDEIGHRIRTRIGTPDARRQGAAHQITNSVWMFSNISKEGTRSMVESFNEDRGAYIWKSLMLNVLPKLVMYGGAAALSAAGNDWLKNLLDKIPEYDKQSYSIIPISINEAGKAVYLRLPQDYDGQNWGAIAWALANGRVLGDGGAIEKASQFIPYTPSSLNPYIKVGTNLFTYYVRGQNPVDDYRGRDIIPPKAFASGGLEASKYMALSTWGQLGGNVLYSPYDFSDRKDGMVEKVLKYPGLNVLGSFLRYSDRGETEKHYQEKNDEIKEKAKLSLKAEGMISKRIKSSKVVPTTDDIFESYRELKSEGVIPQDKTYQEFRNQFFRVAAKTIKDNDIKFLLKLSKKERRATLPEMQKKLSPADYRNLVDDLNGMGALQ